MRKLLLLSCTVALVLGLAASGAWADPIIFPNNTLVQSYNIAGAYNITNLSDSTYVKSDSSGHTWYDVIGNTGTYNYTTYGGKLDGTMLYLYTQFGGATKSEYLDANHTVRVADLFLDTDTSDGNNSYNMSIRLRGATPTTGSGIVSTGVFSGVGAANVSTSIDKMAGASSSWIFGGKYDFGDPKVVPVEVNILNSVDTTAVTWSPVGTAFTLGVENVPADAWEVAIQLAGIQGFDLSNGFDFLWATGTCANDTAEGLVTAGGSHVPLPGALVLLGVGLVRLAAYGRKRRMTA